MPFSLVFRGTKDENAVLCTNKQTYDVKEAETSNSLLLLPDLRWPAQQTVAETGRMLEEKQVIHFCYGQSTLHLTELENSSALALTTIKRLNFYNYCYETKSVALRERFNAELDGRLFKNDLSVILYFS